MDKETSSRVSTLAAQILNTEPLNPDGAIAGTNVVPLFNTLLDHAKIVAGSALAQDQTPGQEPIPDDFLGRLKKERAQLSGKLDALTLYLHNNPGIDDNSMTPRHRNMLERQSYIMSDLLAVLDERLADLAIEARSTEAETADGE